VAVAEDVSERHRHDRRACVAGARRHGQQDRPAASGRAQSGEGQYRGAAPEEERREQGEVRHAVPRAVAMAARRGQEQEHRDAGHHRQRGRRR
jgi:hypothetical protein